ncbi:hypothetical protein AXG93_4542s1490 [Marchantia polymorpha subsp. ruderalis]|uniref:Uncharacterized protein n=1 Tax=Marchantia polymorpha subsp. ruderalis TaxID=1480154 RepID=A0A176W0M9_MARPO|nr:hypothetical protein AXG93_4542s1490 [Marchantia polymorpha subsp. ruderalis]
MSAAAAGASAAALRVLVASRPPRSPCVLEATSARRSRSCVRVNRDAGVARNEGLRNESLKFPSCFQKFLLFAPSCFEPALVNSAFLLCSSSGGGNADYGPTLGFLVLGRSQVWNRNDGKVSRPTSDMKARHARAARPFSCSPRSPAFSFFGKQHRDKLRLAHTVGAPGHRHGSRRP